MTHSQAFTAVERALSALKLKNKWGEEMSGLLALPPVAALHGKDWDLIEDGLESGSLTPKDYADRAVTMIEKFRFRRALEEKLLKLFTA